MVFGIVLDDVGLNKVSVKKSVLLGRDSGLNYFFMIDDKLNVFIFLFG